MIKMRPAILLLVVALVLCLPELSQGIMGYQNISSSRAICNDFSRAGMFVKKILAGSPSSKKWIIFLESGGFCYSAESCNRRFFQSHIRSEAEGGDGNSNLLQSDFDPYNAWMKHKGGDLSRVISPLMTSMDRFRNTVTRHRGQFVIDGTDILSANCRDNPDFCDHNSVVLPYCSSDLWLGNDFRNFTTKDGEELAMENITEQDFYSRIYQPNSSNLQFVFQGANIFRGAIRDLLDSTDLNEAEEVILVGSSAGGVGVMNHAQWLKKQLPNDTTLRLLLDSSWFINFNGVIEREFNGSMALTPSPSAETNATSTEDNLFKIISWHRPCQKLHNNAPCCIAARCLLANPEFFPSDTKVFTIVSLYDVFLLGASLRGLVVLASEEETLKPGYALDFLRTVSEYGGAMNRSITELQNEVDFVSFYITGCFQHIYLATSTLWGDPEETLFGSSPVELDNDVGVIRHAIESGVWSTFQPKMAKSNIYTIKQVISEWHNNTNLTLMFRDTCQGPHCNKNCPETFIPQELDSNSWLPSTKVVLVLVIICVAIVCICLKIVFSLWLWRLEWKQQLYLGSLGDESYTTDIETALQFPDCPDKDAISVACLDLRYTVKVRSQMKDERKDNVTPLVLSDLNPEDELEQGEGCVAPEEVLGEEEMEESEGLVGGEGLPSRYQRMRRAKTRKTLRDTYRSYHDGGSDSSQPEAIRKLRNIAERTFRGSKRIRRGSSSFIDGDYNIPNTPGSLGPHMSSYGSGPHMSSYGSGHDDSNPFTPKSPKPMLVDGYDHIDDDYLKSPLQYESLGGFESMDLSTKDTPVTENTAMAVGENPETDISQQQQQQLLGLSGKGPVMARQKASFSAMRYSREQKRILKGISLYFNPGELIGIMGPSGCGKTTFLDLLTGRRHTGTIQGNIFINGVKMDEVRDWYITNTGYVLQLATPYYEELTVRENLTLAAQIKLSNSFTIREKFQRVEQVMFVSGLLDLAEASVGGTTGPGLSGGQKRRLAVALQLLKLPSVIFLDEPTSGLDAASSFELLSHLNQLADSNRTVILTIHQPRLEIFHMFHRLVLLCDGKVAYHGIPEKAYEVFVNALKTRYLEQGLIIPELEDHNPADVIMDILGNSKMRQIITDYYQSSDEPKYVQTAIDIATVKDNVNSSLMGTSTMNTLTRQFNYALYGAKKVQDKHASIFYRLAALEARASKRLNWTQTLYLPFIFFSYGLLLGTAYFQQHVPLLVMSGFCVYSVASAIFMFPILFHYYSRALEVYRYEHGDGVGNAYDLVIQGFIHAISTAAIPVVVCAGVLYLLLVNVESYDIAIFGQLVVLNLILNQCWTALLIALICAFPKRAFRLSPVISSVAGFASGFFIPIQEMHWGYRWLFYINPNYYGFSASAFLLLDDFQTSCEGSEFECYTSSGDYVLNQFSFDNINPYRQALILLMFTAFYLLLAIFSNWLKHTAITSHFKRVKHVIRQNSALHSTSHTEPASEIPNSTALDDIEEEKNQEELEPLSSSGPQEVPPSPQKFTSTVHFETREVDENGVEVPLDGGHTQVESNESDSETDRDTKKTEDISELTSPQDSHGKIHSPPASPEKPVIQKITSPESPVKPAGVKIPPASPAGRKISFNLESPEKQPRTPTLASPGGRRMSGTPTSPDKLMALHKAPLAKGDMTLPLVGDTSSPSKGRKVMVLSPGEDEGMFVSPLDTYRTITPATPQSAYLKGGESHHVWMPSAMPTKKQPRPISLLSPSMKQKSQTQLLAKRKKCLEHRLLATREIMKLQNEQIASSPTVKKPLSFSEAGKKVSARLSRIKKEQAMDFHNIVDQYMAHMKDQEESQADLQWGAGASATPMSPVTKLAETPAVFPGSPVRGGRKNYGYIALQAPRLMKKQQGPVAQASKSNLLSSSPPSTPTTPSSPGPMVPVRAIPISLYRQGVGGMENLPSPQKKAWTSIKHPLEKSSTEVSMSTPNLEVEKKPRTQSFGGIIDKPATRAPAMYRVPSGPAGQYSTTSTAAAASAVQEKD